MLNNYATTCSGSCSSRNYKRMGHANAKLADFGCTEAHASNRYAALLVAFKCFSNKRTVCCDDRNNLTMVTVLHQALK